MTRWIGVAVLLAAAAWCLSSLILQPGYRAGGLGAAAAGALVGLAILLREERPK